jgi:hypothetical protein
MTVGSTGAAAMAGKLPDGESFSISWVLNRLERSEFSIKKPLSYPSATSKGAKGLLAGTLAFGTLPGSSDFSGTLTWTKPEQSKGDYQAAIDTTLNVIGSLYTRPANGSSALPGFGNGTLLLSDTSGLSLSASSQLTGANKLVVTDPSDNLKVSLTPTTGVIKGMFLYPGQKAPTAFTGVLFQDQTIGEGFFLGPNGSGTVSLKSP